MLDADRQAHGVLADPGPGELGRIQLAMGGRRRMGGQRLRIPQVHQPGEQLQCIKETRAGNTPARQAEGQHAGAVAAQIALRRRVFGVVGQPGITHPRHLRMRAQVLRHGQRIGIDPLHAQGQGLDALQDQEGIER
ncbi:hypothetical protein D3C81_874110 [compost metagenome]